MPLWSAGRPRKRWRYVGLYDERLMLCAAVASIGPAGQCFWALWDREGRRRRSRVRMRPGSREVAMDGPLVEIDAPDMRATLRLGDAAPVEAICPSGAGWGWTRKRAGLPIEAEVEVPGRRWRLEGRGVDDESAGYHARSTSWWWSAGVGRGADGRALAWNLVEGINDPPAESERAIWVDGAPSEPAPVRFAGLGAVELDAEERLEFAAEDELAHEQNMAVVRSRYRHLFGRFSGSLAGVELASGLGVMERHEAVW
jgi:hypothetical protein